MSDAAPSEHTRIKLRTPQLHWRGLVGCRTLDDAVALVAEEYDFAVHPYFLWMRDEATTVAAFRLSQVPFRYAVEGFSQSLAAVLARIPRLEARLALADNVAEEHGRGNELASHKRTFFQYLRALDATQEELGGDCPVAVRAFSHALLDFCLTQPYQSGAALLGIIEHLYVAISGDIADTIATRGWARAGSQSHYAVHHELDVEHAEDLLALARPAWSDESARAGVALGMLLGAYWFWHLYRELLPA